MAPSRRISGWLVFVIVAIVLLGCLVAAGVGILSLLRVRDSEPTPLPVDPTATTRVTRTPTRIARETPTPQPSPTRTQRPVRSTPTPTRKPTGTRTSQSTPTATSTPDSTATAAPTPTPTEDSTATTAPTPTPTPVICEGIESATAITLAPGQSFTCTVTDDELIEQVSKVPDLPCSDVQVEFADGEIRVSCRIGIRLTATAELSVQDCQATMEIVGGTPGFVQVVQTLLDQYAELLSSDRVCIEETTVEDGVLTVSGYGK